MAEKKRRRGFRSKALQYACDRYVGDDSERNESFEDELLNARIASQIYDAAHPSALVLPVIPR